jgi:parallel beta-helix repeat protein
LAETTSAHIEQNDIYTNFKANIALGGINSGDTVIMRNRIRESRSEGIFLLESGFCQIIMNEVYGNNDGIVLVDSTCLLERNDVTENARAGIICSGLSFPKITKNVIAHNLASGVLFRDESMGDCSFNKVSFLIEFNF